MNTVEKLAGLIRETSSSLPEDVESALAKAKRREQGGSSASVVLGTVLDKLKPTPARTQQRNRALYGIVRNAVDKGERCGERNV